MSTLTEVVVIKPLGVTLHPRTASDVVAEIKRCRQTRQTLWIANYNLHALYLRHADRDFINYYAAADMYLIDGWPLLVASRFRTNGLSSDHRVGSSDWLAELLETDEAIKIVAIGGSPSSSSTAAEKIAADHPAIEWRAYDGFEFLKQDELDGDPTLEGALEDCDLVVVGLGMPKQESWIYEHLQRGKLDGKVVANIGGCIDYLSGEQKLAPRWTGRIGMEWLYRLIAAPSRLYVRYLIEPVRLAGLVLRYNTLSRSLVARRLETVSGGRAR